MNENRSIPCILVASADESPGPGSRGPADPSLVTGYDAYRKLVLPFVPNRRTSITRLFPLGAELSSVFEGGDDDLLGWEPTAVAWDCALSA